MANVHANVITAELGTYLRKHVAACLRLLDEGATVPFISRYRKEATGKSTCCLCACIAFWLIRKIDVFKHNRIERFRYPFLKFRCQHVALAYYIEDILFTLVELCQFLMAHLDCMDRHFVHAACRLFAVAGDEWNCRPFVKQT